MKKISCAEALNEALREEMRRDALVFVMGEDVGKTANSLDMCWEAVRRDGILAQVGIYPSRIETDLNNVVMKELTVVGSFGYVWRSWRRSIQLLSEGRINAEAQISHEVPLTEFEQAFRMTQDGTATKVVFNIG
jgi:L-iditol 2-dehydrogenase